MFTSKHKSQLLVPSTKDVVAQRSVHWVLVRDTVLCFFFRQDTSLKQCFPISPPQHICVRAKCPRLELSQFPRNEAAQCISTPSWIVFLVYYRVTLSVKFTSTHLYPWVKRCTMREKCLAQEQCSAPATAQTWTAQSRIQCTIHQATAPPKLKGAVS